LIVSLAQKEGHSTMNSGRGGPPNVCFYSNSCKLCAGFIKALGETPHKGDFTFVCVDGKIKELTQKYSWLKRVPTLVIRGEEDPRSGNECFNWLSEKQIMENRAAEGGGSAQEPEPWIGTEMGGALTKGFSFIGANDSNDAPVGNFSFLSGQNAVATRTASDIPGGGLGARGQQKSKKEAMFDQQYEAFLRQRNDGVAMPPSRQ